MPVLHSQRRRFPKNCIHLVAKTGLFCYNKQDLSYRRNGTRAAVSASGARNTFFLRIPLRDPMEAHYEKAGVLFGKEHRVSCRSCGSCHRLAALCERDSHVRDHAQLQSHSHRACRHSLRHVGRRVSGTCLGRHHLPCHGGDGKRAFDRLFVSGRAVSSDARVHRKDHDCGVYRRAFVPSHCPQEPSCRGLCRRRRRCRPQYGAVSARHRPHEGRRLGLSRHAGERTGRFHRCVRAHLAEQFAGDRRQCTDRARNIPRCLSCGAHGGGRIQRPQAAV